MEIPTPAHRSGWLTAALVAVLAAGCRPEDAPIDPVDDGDGAANVIPLPAWTAPVGLFDTEIRIAAGTRLHAVGVTGGAVMHRSSGDQGATWSDPVRIAGAGILPIYGPLAAEGSDVYVLTGSSGRLRVQRSADAGLTWSAPVALEGHDAGAADRVQMDVENGVVHVFVGRAGATPDANFKICYWRSLDAGLSFGGPSILDDSATEPPSPGGIAVENGVVHVAYAALTLPGTLGHRARYLRSTDNGSTWSPPVDVSGAGSNPQIRPRPRVLDGRVLVLWEECLDHDPSRPYPNATRSAIRATISRDNGTTWEAPFTISDLPEGYENHPEVAVGPAGRFHVIYRVSADQATLTDADPVGYRGSGDYGTTWGGHETAIDDPGRESHPVNLVATAGFVHAVSPSGVYVRRPLP